MNKKNTKKKKGRIIFNCSNSIGAQLHNVRVIFKTLKICFSRKKLLLTKLRRKLYVLPNTERPFLFQIASPNRCTGMLNSFWGSEQARPECYHGSIKIKLAIAHISELPLPTKVSGDIGCTI